MSQAPILLVTLEYPPQKGGIATYLGNLVRVLPPGQVHVLAPPHGDTHEHDVRQATPIYRRQLLSKWLRPRWLAALFWTDWLVRKERPSHLVVSHLLPLGTVAWIMKWLYKTPYMVILHGMDIALALERGGHKAALAKRVLKEAALVTVNSAYTAHLAESAGVPRNKLVVAHPSPAFGKAEIALYRSAEAAGFAWETRDNHGLGNGYMVLSTGRLVERKGFDTLISAIAALNRRGRRVTLAIAGGGPDRKRLEELAWKEGVSEHVRFLGAVDHGELPALFAACDVFVLAPRSIGGDVEGFGIVYLEAGLLAKPVIGTRTGGVPEAVLDESTGLLVPPGDVDALVAAILKLMDDPALAARLGFEGRRRVERDFDPALQFKPIVDFLTRP